MRFFWRVFPMLLCLVLLTALTLPAGAADSRHAELIKAAAELSPFTGLKYYKNENTERYLSYKAINRELSWEAVVTYVNIGLDTLFYSNPTVVSNPSAMNALVNKYHPLPSDYVPKDLELIDPSYNYGDYALRRSARIGFDAMCYDAAALGYTLYATSGYRSYDRQKEVYDSFFDTGDPMTAFYQTLFAARPGYSEHQTGLAVDTSIDSTDPDAFGWYSRNAYKYGFIIRYPYAKEPILGYSNEPWHLRYLGVDLAAAVYRSGLTYDEYYAREIDLPVKNAGVSAVGVTTVHTVSAGAAARPLSTYDVLGETYYKLRDIAAILNATPMQFDIVWDAPTGRISLTAGKPYTGPNALSAAEPGHAAVVTQAKPTISVLGIVYTPDAYTAGGSNYMKLRDILGMLGLRASDDGMGGLVIAPDSTVGTPPGSSLSEKK